MVAGVFKHLRRSSKSQGSLDLSASMQTLESRLTEQTDLIDEMKKVLPLTVAAPGIVALGGAGAGKSTILEAITNVPLARGTSGLRRPIRLRIIADPTCTKEYALVSGSDPLLKDDTRRIENLESELPRALAALGEQGGLEDTIHLRVVRPSGPTYSVIDFPALSSPPTEEEAAALRRLLVEEEKDRLILAVLPVTDVFERADAVYMAKELDPESKRTIGVVTKMHLLTKEMGIVEKLQMTSHKELILPLGYVAVCASVPSNPSAKRAQVLEHERAFFSSNPLLRGLKTDRWGLPALKQLVIKCQTNFIAQCIPALSHNVRAEIEAMKRDAEARDFSGAGAGSASGSTSSGSGSTGPKGFDSTGEFFSRLCSEVTSVAFDINDLANGSVTRQERKFNLGPRFLHAVETREAEARKQLPDCLSGQVAQWLTRELDEFRGVITNSDSMMHPIFRKAVRELCLPVLRVYARNVVEDADGILKEVMGALIDERFGDYSRLVEALKRDVALTQAQKRAEAETLIFRLLESELNWIFVNDVDLQRIQKEVEAGLAAPGAERRRSVEAELWGGEDPSALPEATTEGASLGLSRSGKPLLQTEESRELRAMQLALNAYIRLLLRRIFYAVPMNCRNVIMNEFRQDLVLLVSERYNDEQKIRTLMSEELWVNHKRQQRGERMAALQEVLRKLDLLS